MSDTPEGDAALDALIEAIALKGLSRSGWVRKGVTRPESVAAHSWGVSWLVLALRPEGIDLARALAYAVLHDLPEVRTGDVTPHDGVDGADKHAAERAAMAMLCAPLARGPELRALWDAYEAQADPEARLVRQLDRLDMALQAVAYAEAGAAGMGEFLDSARRAITDPKLLRILDALRQRIDA